MALGPQTLGESLRLLMHRASVSGPQLAERTEGLLLAAGLDPGGAKNATVRDYISDKYVPRAHVLRAMVAVLAAELDVNRDDLWADIGRVLDVAMGAPLDAHAAVLADQPVEE